jgi:transcriptional regulator with XRE-family HTH domain
MKPLNIKGIIKSWGWRIVRLDHTLPSFADLINISRTNLSHYISGRASPKIETIELIENSIRRMEERTNVEERDHE